jgi:hypothetical protein
MAAIEVSPGIWLCTEHIIGLVKMPHGMRASTAAGEFLIDAAVLPEVRAALGIGKPVELADLRPPQVAAPPEAKVPQGSYKRERKGNDGNTNTGKPV